MAMVAKVFAFCQSQVIHVPYSAATGTDGEIGFVA
jgi:hypothetical protein